MTNAVNSVPWASEMQLVQFCRSAEQVAAEVVKASNIRLRKGRKRTDVRDYGAYCQGKADSQKFDVRQRLVE